MTDRDEPTPYTNESHEKTPTEPQAVERTIGSAALELMQNISSHSNPNYQSTPGSDQQRAREIGMMTPEELSQAQLIEWPEGEASPGIFLDYFLKVFSADELRVLREISRHSPQSMQYFLDYAYETFRAGDTADLIAQSAAIRTRRLHAAIYGVNPHYLAHVDSRKVSAIRTMMKSIADNFSRNKTKPSIMQAFDHTVILATDPSKQPSDLPPLPLPQQSMRIAAHRTATHTPAARTVDLNNADRRGVAGALWNKPELANGQPDIADILGYIAPDFDQLDQVVGHFQIEPTGKDAVNPDVLRDFLESMRGHAEDFLESNASTDMLQKLFVKQLFGIPVADRPAVIMSASSLAENHRTRGGKTALQALAKQWLDYCQSQNDDNNHTD